MSSPGSRAFAAWNRMFDEPGSLRAVALHRVFVGGIVLVHLWPFLHDMAAGRYYADSFYQPWFDWLPQPPRTLYFGLLIACCCSAVCMTLGLLTRASVTYTWAFVGYNLFLNQLHFHHNRAFLFINLTCLALLPCGRVLSLDARLARRRGEPLSDQASLWPMYLLRFEAVSVYAASGGSKLLNADWFSGLVTFDRVVRFRHKLEASIAPEWFIDLITRRDFHFVFGKVAVATELFIAVGLLLRPTRYAAVWVAILFHVAIGIGLEVQIFSYLAISALLIWVTPRTRDRRLVVDPSRPDGRRLALWVPRLDWLARFELQERAGAGAAVLTDRNGRELHGPAATRLVLSRCPLSFPFAAPLRLLFDRGAG